MFLAFHTSPPVPPFRFAAKADRSLPSFSYAGPALHHGGSACLVGDTIHTVKPYFGQGVNSALEDVQVWGRGTRVPIWGSTMKGEMENGAVLEGPGVLVGLGLPSFRCWARALDGESDDPPTLGPLYLLPPSLDGSSTQPGVGPGSGRSRR